MTLTTGERNTPESTRRRLSWFALIAGSAELLFATLVERRWRRRQAAAPVQQQPLEPAWRFGVLGLGIVGPLVIHATKVLGTRQSRRVAVLAAIATLASGFILRVVLVFGGNESARRPEDYFRVTRAPAPSVAGQGATESAAGRSER